MYSRFSGIQAFPQLCKFSYAATIRNISSVFSFIYKSGRCSELSERLSGLNLCRLDVENQSMNPTSLLRLSLSLLPFVQRFLSRGVFHVAIRWTVLIIHMCHLTTQLVDQHYSVNSQWGAFIFCIPHVVGRVSLAMRRGVLILCTTLARVILYLNALTQVYFRCYLKVSLACLITSSSNNADISFLRV